MRYVDIINAAELGLTEEEIDFLMPEAKARFDEFSKRTGYDLKNDGLDEFNRHISNKRTSEIFGSDRFVIVEISAIRAFINGYASRTNRDWNLVDGLMTSETILDKDGFGLVHNSYGTIQVGNPSGASDFMVGSSSLSQYSKTLSLMSARVDVSDDDKIRLMGGIYRHIEMTFSSEQFSMLVRGDKGFLTPCGLEVSNQHWNDCPPKLTFSAVGSVDMKAKIGDIIAPLEVEAKRLGVMISEGASKKAEYAALIDQAKTVLSIYEEIEAEMINLAMEFGAKEGDRAQRQFELEMTSRLEQLQLSGSLHEIMLLTKQ